jgi:hypothetical protein
VDQQDVLDAVREYLRVFPDIPSLTAIRVRGGPTPLGQGRTAWLVTVEADGAHLLVSMAVLETGSLVFGHLRLTP